MITKKSFLVLLALFFLTGCSGEDGGGNKPGRLSPPASQDKDSRLTVGINTTIKSTPFIWASETGIFAEHGLDVKLQSFESGIAAGENVFSGQIDLAAVPEHMVAWKSLHNPDFRVVAVLNRNETSVLVGRRDRGITGVKSLKGKTIGAKIKSASPFWLHRLLVYHDLTAEDITLVDGRPSELVESLGSGKVDAVVTWYPYVHYAQKALRENAFSLPVQMGQDLFWVLIARRSMLEDQPEKMVRFLQAIDQANKAITNEPDKVQKLVASYLGVSLRDVALEWPRHSFQLELPQSFILAMEQECRWKLNQEKNGQNVPDFLDFISFAPMNKVKPDAVTIIH